MRWYLSCLCLALGLSLVLGETKKPGNDAMPSAIAPYVDDQTIAVAHVDMSKVDVDAIVNYLQELAPGSTAENDKLKAAGNQWVKEFTRAGGKDCFAVFRLAIPEQAFVLVTPVRPDGNAASMAALFTAAGLKTETRHGVVLAGDKESVHRLATLKPAKRSDLAAAFATGGTSAVRVAVAPPATLRKAMDELVPALPKEFGGGSTKSLVHGLLWAVMHADLPATPHIHVMIKTRDAATATEVDKLVHTVFELARKEIAEHSGNKAGLDIERMTKLLTPKIEKNELVVDLDKVALAEMKPLVAKMRQTAARQRAQNSFKQIGLALHNYHDTHKGFPPAAVQDKQGKPLLSWRVAILPYIEQDNLYKQFHLDEPWDSEHNKQFIVQMPAPYRGLNEQLNSDGKTTMLAFRGKQTMFPDRPKGVEMKEVIDGTSTTIFVVGADESRAVPWTKPVDLPFNPDDPKAGLPTKQDWFLALFVDGAVGTIPISVKKETLKALITRDGGEVVADY